MVETILPYDRSIVPQETGWWCGPASLQVVTNGLGHRIPEATLAAEVEQIENPGRGDDRDGTDYIGLLEQVLDRRVPDKRYTSVYTPTDPMTGAQKERFWQHLQQSILGNRAGVIANIVAPPNNPPRATNGSTAPPYPRWLTTFHYVAIMGLDDTPGARAVWIADSANFGGISGFWCPFDGPGSICSLIPPKGYCYAAAAGADTAPAPAPVPAPAPASTAAAVLAAATGITEAKAADILPTLQQGLRLSDCTTAARIAAWLAQIGHESAGFNATEEYASGDESTDRWRYKGRTWIQITWRANYAGFSQWAHRKGLVDSADYFVRNPKRLADLRWAGIGPGWYWTVARPDINTLCDRGDFDMVTYRINGGQNGADDRRRRHRLALAQGDKLLTLLAGAQPDTEEGLPMGELYSSVSIYRTPGEGARYSLAQLIQSIDGFAHRAAVEDAALTGSLDDIDRIFRVAAGRGAVTDAWAVNHAKNFLVRLERENPGALIAYREKKGVV